MRKSVSIFCLLCTGLLLAAPVFGAGPLKLRFVDAIYKDVQEVGLLSPEGVACAGDYFIVADTGNNRLVKYTYQDNVVQPVEFEIPLNAPIVVQVNSKNEIYGLDGRDRRILVLNPDGTEKGYLAPKGAPVGQTPVLKSFAIDQKDRIYLLDIAAEAVVILDSSQKYLRHIPFPEKYGFISDIAVDDKGGVYLVDSTEPAVYYAGPEADSFAALSKGLNEYANFPASLAVDSSGTIYVVDKHGGSLVLLGRDGSFLGHQFGYGWRESQFYYPAQICIASNGYVFVADRNNNRVQIFREME